METRSIRSVRLLGAALAVAAFAHVPPTSHHLADAPYMGVGFVLFTVACVGLLLALTSTPGRAVLLTTAAVCGGGVAVYAATRLVAFPGLGHDVGAWLDPLGVVAVAAELTATAAAVHLLRARREPAAPRLSPAAQAPAAASAAAAHS